ncbi:uroporphyrinogen-III synthase [Rheinheimera baltica]|uniref:Uroporphyrinogen-III synthase n=1 Tax=Rheinheimera baltica TaxID=67576 RepID=A0ABT9I315_9GAMM|nr:uroporphyrinogen-III synthase [Rheinheimera baltica]MDP5137430.1 uroporphyrinogen-III synthase [Rheinheimera baltica]MDP5144738.1 uroporphyrinogen-III synthase [Rheinheimera baltica]MDP5151971.1 uroporphyrinogen-III synthase [Rheinheimera baltica]MDP5190163.1 uroporphyrinogen-III synthase [Rheinheimera baltica]
MTTAMLESIPFLITRPAGKADNLLASLDSLGVGYLYQPLITTAQVSLKQQDQQQLQNAAAVIFVSVSAVNSLQNQYDGALLTAPLFAVGQTTALALHRWLGREVIVPEDQRSEGLLQLPQLHDVSGKQLVVVRGNAGRELIKQTLVTRGASVRYVQSYKRQPLPLDGALLCQQWQLAGIRCIVATSNEILQQLFNLVPSANQHWLQQCDWILVSPRMQESAIALGIATERITLADNANDSALLAAISQLQREYQ